jgi:hypothetical protein
MRESKRWSVVVDTDELAVARALADLGNHLLVAADIGANTHESEVGL